KDGGLVHGKSAVRVPALALDFGAPPASLILTARVDARDSGMHTFDFLEALQLDHDPRFSGLSALAKGTADVSYVLGGPRDACGGGRMTVAADLALSAVDIGG